ncbi:hypothetical protein C8R45DRAFT_786112, partial [Mycena sanguinolenta]
FSLSADSISCADVVNLVKTLNANIFQAAALIAESLEYAPMEHTVDKITGHELGLGENITKRLPSGNPGVAQIALQAAISSWCKREIDSWCVVDKIFGQNLSGLYEKILRAGDSTTAHRWRAITRAQTKRSDERILLTTSLVECVCHVMFLAGWELSNCAVDGQELIKDQFEGQISAIVKCSQQLRTATGEEIVSEDLEVAYVEPDCMFEERTMEDADGIRGRVKDESRMLDIVEGTVDIGLQRR